MTVDGKMRGLEFVIIEGFDYISSKDLVRKIWQEFEMKGFSLRRVFAPLTTGRILPQLMVKTL